MSSRSTLGTIKRIAAILLAIAIVLSAGVIIGQAPAIFGVEEAPEASITFEDQEGNGTVATIDEVSLSDGGFVVLTDDDGEELAVSAYLEAGSHENVAVEREEEGPELLGSLTATVHQDTTDDETFAYHETDGEEDRPYLADGFPVSDSATVTSDEDDDALLDSFAVDSVTVPATATTNETITVVAEIENPTDLLIQQPVEFRIDGQLLEQQTLELESGESQEVSAQIDTSSFEPGERTVGVYTAGDGALETIDLEFHTDPSIDVVDADDESATVDVAIPAEGFVAVFDNETDDRLGTSEGLEAGEHEDVTVEFDENVTVEDDDELLAALYEGDPTDPDAATAIEDDDGDPVETTFTLEEIADELEANDEDDTEDEDDDDGDDDGEDNGDDDGGDG